MTYTPINWQTGDTITAEKMNKMDNGWGVESTQLFSETVTTTDQGGMISAQLTYSTWIEQPTLTITFSGTDYVMPMIDNGEWHIYGEVGAQGPSFANYPFCLVSVSGEGNTLYTETAGTYTVAVVGDSIATSVNFGTAVQTVVNQMAITPQWLEEGVTTYQETVDAINNNRIVCFNANGGIRYVSSVVSGRVVYVPEDASFTAGFSVLDNTFEITWQ